MQIFFCTQCFFRSVALHVSKACDLMFVLDARVVFILTLTCRAFAQDLCVKPLLFLSPGSRTYLEGIAALMCHLVLYSLYSVGVCACRIAETASQRLGAYVAEEKEKERQGTVSTATYAWDLGCACLTAHINLEPCRFTVFCLVLKSTTNPDQQGIVSSSVGW